MQLANLQFHPPLLFTSKFAIELKYFKPRSLWSCTLINMVSRKCWINKSTLKTILRLNLSVNITMPNYKFIFSWDFVVLKHITVFRVTGIVFNLLVTISKLQQCWSKGKQNQGKEYIIILCTFAHCYFLSLSQSKK